MSTICAVDFASNLSDEGSKALRLRSACKARFFIDVVLFRVSIFDGSSIVDRIVAALPGQTARLCKNEEI